MNAFEPEPTQSPRKIASWVFTRSLLITVFTGYGILLAWNLFGLLRIPAMTAIGLYGVWYSYLVVFRGVDALLEGRTGATP
ncbi:hypothetical protein [Natronobacterium texcoconense]|uniref:Uncharacterized protein n=1 Tax=Natronobacterium texcoconense TaxID=1095778 RepID=A0A1H1IR21_NATTX|nr:hypothetical protein [Natronobacterium texcoconense]SDR39786.1 hypothetical protein SAMN04489842_3710 [Natronobacterium texcoconense]